MSKARAAGVLGALILCGLLFLSSLAVAGRDPYFAKLQGAFRRACSELAESGGLRTNIDADAFLDACLFVVEALKLLPIPPLNATLEETEEAFLEAVWKKTPDLRGSSTCDECILAALDLEVNLAANNTIEDIRDALVVGCGERFSDSAEAAQCGRFVAAVPRLVDFFFANFPPLIACRELNFCPLE
jgi:hypothetical protein